MNKSLIVKSIATALILSNGVVIGDHDENVARSKFKFDATNKGCELTNKKGINVIKEGHSDCGTNSGDCSQNNDARQEGAWIHVSDEETCAKISDTVIHSKPNDINGEYRKHLDESLFE